MNTEEEIPSWLIDFPPTEIKYWLDKTHAVQEKVHFYAVALAFTILGLSVQTAKYNGPITAQIAELVACTN